MRVSLYEERGCRYADVPDPPHKNITIPAEHILVQRTFQERCVPACHLGDREWQQIKQDFSRRYHSLCHMRQVWYLYIGYVPRTKSAPINIV